MNQQLQVFQQIDAITQLMQVKHLSNVADFCILDFENESGLRCPNLARYGQVYYEIVINTTATCSFHIENETITPQGNTVTLIKPWQLQGVGQYEETATELAKGYIIYFSPSYLEVSDFRRASIFDRSQITSFTFSANDISYFTDLASAMYREYINYDPTFSAKIIRNYLEIFLLKLQQHHVEGLRSIAFPNASKRIYYHFLEAVDSNFTSYSTIEQYAQLLNITPKHLSETIKAETGKNALSIVNDARISYAKTLLLQTKKSVKEIADDMGFVDANNFSSYFRKHTNSTPTTFRKK